MKFRKDVHVPQKIGPNDLGDFLTLHHHKKADLFFILLTCLENFWRII